MKTNAGRRLRARQSRRGPTGELARSITINAGDWGFQVGSDKPHAAIQQLGGTIVPVTVKALAIPMLPHLWRNRIWPRDLPKDSMRYIPVNKGNVVGKLVRAQLTDFAAEQKKPGAKGPRSRPKQKIGELMYLLVKSVKIRGQPYIVFGPEEEAFLLRDAEGAALKAIDGK